ncbi:lipase member H-like isoform X2 [Plectropomus leopardus]|uniref:lipase member H-like isoform X2 n=1 Tax=Plectropomus leopardus TaxID=160734 RepID=UPI001C4D3397|nr:lipase member H-like isoform X2 [Plectropomus leopardus]
MFLWQYLALLLPITVQVCKAQRCEDFTDLDLSHAIIGTSLKIRLLLYTRENDTCGTLISHTNLSAHPEFNFSTPTTFIIHGYRPTGSPPVWVHTITEMLLEREDMNVIVVDWNHGAANVNYFKAVENTHKAADNLTAFIKMMQEHGASLSSIHMIGVSLGAHISGFVGANLNGSIGWITALGFREPLGHIDFYANGGTDQPGCPRTIFSGGAYFKCDHQRSVLLYLDSVNRTCVSTAFPCNSYKDFLDGNCLNCDRFGAAGCPVFGYDIREWKDVLLRLRETKTYFTTNAVTPFCRTNYRMEVMVWNKDVRWGYITVKLHGDGEEAVATIDHKASEFKKYTETKLLAQFDKDIHSVRKVSLKFSTGNVFKPKHKLRVLRIRLSHLERKERPLCRYDFLLEENKEFSFKPIPCEDSNF